MDQCYNTLTLWRRFLVRRSTGEWFKPGYRNIPFARISARRGTESGCATGSDWLLGSAVPGMSIVGCVSGTICPDASPSGVSCASGVCPSSLGSVGRVRSFAPDGVSASGSGTDWSIACVSGCASPPTGSGKSSASAPFLLDSGTGAPCHRTRRFRCCVLGLLLAGLVTAVLLWLAAAMVSSVS